ncbi:MAG: putative portal protein [Prokaryotic dsDNA virus sp.]|nr:MAG: putative portal protein [Prokaryotic dsDNA virus sp.]|tara:strand:- start:47536 stop:49836 length:2301 start_codon:yes stop_codon:yes gene_type:complete
MAKKITKEVQRIHDLFEIANGENRAQWEYINQKGVDFANDNQLTDEERVTLEEQGMPTFTINRILPVVEMLNFYATANKPRWQAVGVDGSDTDVAAVFSDMADYIWDLSDGSSLYANCVNDSVTKGVGYMHVTVDQDSDNGMGDVVIKQPEPFDLFVDPKSRDLLFRDASFVMIRKILPKSHLLKIYPDLASKIKKSASLNDNDYNYSEKSRDKYMKDFGYKDVDTDESPDKDGARDDVVEFFETYEKIKIKYVNVFYQQPLTKEVLQQIQQQVKVQMQEMASELQVKALEQQKSMEAAVQSGEMIPERFQLEMQKMQEGMQQQLAQAEQQMTAELQQQATIIQNMVITEKEFKVISQDKKFAATIVDAVPFHGDRIQLCCSTGDTMLYKKILPEGITEYPIVPFHYKWTGTPYPISAVSPLMGKQREVNKAHQLLVHNASLGSSLRFVHEEGSIDTDYWEKYSSAPGALLPVRPGSTPPTPIQPAPLNSAFFNIVQNSKSDMEYLAGIYSSMMGDTGSQHETYRGMLAMDEYGTRRIKQWMQNALEPALKQMGTIIKQFTQSVYTAQKTFRIVQPSALQEQRQVEINIPVYNDLGEAVGKIKDYSAAKFDVRIIAGSTMPINRWAYISELKEMMQMGIVDDIAVLAETDLRNKEQIAKRKSIYSQLQGQVQSMESQLKKQSGTIETLERQLVQAGIKDKVNQAEVELAKKKGQVDSNLEKQYLETEAKQKLAQKMFMDNANLQKQRIKMEADNIIKDLTDNNESD